MAWLNSTSKKLQAFHWHDAIGLNDLQFIDGSGASEATDYIDFLELSGQQQTTRTIRFVMGDIGGGSGSYVVYNVWFADSKAELETAVSDTQPTKIVFTPLFAETADVQPSIYEFNISARYMAINFDPAYGNVDPASTYISIYAY